MKFFQKLENLFSAAAFAEEGDFETARQIAKEEAPTEKRRAVAKGSRARSGRSRHTTPTSSEA